MTIEEQFAKAVKEQTENLDREVTAGATYIRLLNEHFGPGSDIYCHNEHKDEKWDENQKKVWVYLLTNEHVSYMHLRELLEDIGTSGGVWSVVQHCLWMAYFCTLETEEEVDEVLAQVKECDYCQDVPIAYIMQYVLFNQPMSAEVVSAIVHADGMWEFAQMMWEVVEATGQGFYHSELRTNSLQAA
jgi:hypothetical protein